MAMEEETAPIGVGAVSATQLLQGRGAAFTRVVETRVPDAGPSVSLDMAETVIARFSNSKPARIRRAYMAPIWRLQTNGQITVLADLDELALEFPVAIDDKSTAMREVQAIARAIPIEHVERYLSVYRETWSEQNALRPEGARAHVSYSSQDDRSALHSFAVCRAREELVLADGSRLETVEAVTDHFAVDREHALFVELTYSERLAPEKVDRSLQAILRGQAL